MASPVASEIRRRAQGAHSFGVVYLAILLFSFHWALVAFVNSSYLYQFVSDKAVGGLYTIGSILTIIAFFFIARALRRFGNYAATLALALCEIALLLGMAFIPSVYFAVPLFLAHHAIVPLLLFNVDIFTEHLIGRNEGVTGGKRGIVLVILSLGGAVAALAAGFLLGSGEPRFTLLYLVSAAFMLAFFYLAFRCFRGFRDPSYADINMIVTLRHFWVTHDFRFVFLAHVLLQLFFAWMVIYVPLYLFSVIGFAWDEIGLILFVALFAYVLFEYPIGEIADRYIGEKEMMGVGFMILAITTIYIAFLKMPLLLPWMVTMFMTRLGAALVEATTESYFFKHTRDADASVISFFRASRPLAYLLGALLGTLSLLYIPFNYTFVLLGILMLPGTAFAMLLKDTR